MIQIRTFTLYNHIHYHPFHHQHPIIIAPYDADKDEFPDNNKKRRRRRRRNATIKLENTRFREWNLTENSFQTNLQRGLAWNILKGIINMLISLWLTKANNGIMHMNCVGRRSPNGLNFIHSMVILVTREWLEQQNEEIYT